MCMVKETQFAKNARIVSIHYIEGYNMDEMEAQTETDLFARLRRIRAWHECEIKEVFEECRAYLLGVFRQQANAAPMVSISPTDMASVAALAETLNWTPAEIVHKTIRRYATEANPMWDAKGARPLEILRFIQTEMLKDEKSP